MAFNIFNNKLIIETVACAKFTVPLKTPWTKTFFITKE